MSMIDHRTPPDDSMSDEQLMQYESHFAVSQPFKDKAKFILHKRATAKSWYEKPFGIVLLSVTATLLAAYLVYIFGFDGSKENKPKMKEENKSATSSSNIPKKIPSVPFIQKK